MVGWGLTTLLTQEITEMMYFVSTIQLLVVMPSSSELLSVFQEYRKLQTRVEELERLLEDHGINRSTTPTNDK